MTKRTRTLTLAAIALSAVCAAAQTNAEKAFAAIKNMPGTWEGTSAEGPVKVTFKVTAGGNSVMSEILGKEDMISMINICFAFGTAALPLIRELATATAAGRACWDGFKPCLKRVRPFSTGKRRRFGVLGNK